MKILCVPDFHAPFHHKDAWKVLLQVAKHWKPDACIVLGDFVDMYSASSFTKNPANRWTVQKELACAAKELKALSNMLPSKTRRVFLEGNHEHRLKRYIADKAPELNGALTVQDALGLKQLGFEFFPYQVICKIGKFHFVHDVGRCGANAAQQALNEFGGNLVVGHTHRAAVAYKGNLRGDRHVSITSGWLGDASRVDYIAAHKARGDWQLGFSVVHLDKSSGNGWATFVPIIQGKAVVDGIMYDKTGVVK